MNEASEIAFWISEQRKTALILRSRLQPEEAERIESIIEQAVEKLGEIISLFSKNMTIPNL